MATLPHTHPHNSNSLTLYSPPPPTFHPHDRTLAHPPSEHLEGFSELGGKDLADDRPESEKKELWSYQDTSMLIDLYEQIFVMLGRGMVRKNDWKRMAEQLSEQSGCAKTAEQCKNRIEYLRKHFRKEKAKCIGSQSESSWVFYKRLESLVQDLTKGSEASKLTAEIPGGVDSGDSRQQEVEAQGHAQTFSRGEDEPTSPAHQNSHPVDTLDEEETVATKGQAASTPETSCKPGKKRRKLVASLGKDLKEGLSEFAAVMERIERTKMELVVMLERQRVEQEQKRAEMEMERTRMLLQNQLEVARLFCGNRAHGRGFENDHPKQI